MVDPDEHEQAAVVAGGRLAGEYLESIAKTDLTVLTEAEWLTFIEAAVTGFQDEMVRRLGSGNSPSRTQP